MLLINKNDKGEGSRKLWDDPWKYAESYLIALIILLLGFIIEISLGGKAMVFPSNPTNIYFFLFFAVTLLLIHLRYRENMVVKWISSIPASISAISLYAFLVLLLGLIPQDSQNPSPILEYTGLSQLKNSWAFLLAQFYLLIALGMVTLRRAIPFKTKNIGFILNHFGLWITLLAIGLGSTDLQRATLDLTENGEAESKATTQTGETIDLPFSLKLLDFTIEEYSPKLILLNSQTKEYDFEKSKTLPYIDKNSVVRIDHWQIEVVEFKLQSLVSMGKIIASDSIGSFPAAFILARNTATNDTVSGWISSGSYNFPPLLFGLGESGFLTLSLPEPQKFSSTIVVSEASSPLDTIELAVNKPFTVRDWKIYQVGYDESRGKWSTFSRIEAVKDPWLPVVYVGFCLLMAGSFYLFWIGKNKKGKLY